MASHFTQQQSRSDAKSPFFQQRDALVGEIASTLEHVLQNINKLNRALEGVIAVGSEFGAVEALWSQFEGVMAQEPEDAERKEGAENEGGKEKGNEEEEGEEEEAASSAKEKSRGR